MVIAAIQEICLLGEYVKKAAQLNILALWQVTVKTLLWSNSPSPSLEAYLGVIASLGETWMARPTVLAPHFHRLASLLDPLKQKRSKQLLYLSPSWWFEPKTSTLEASGQKSTGPMSTSCVSQPTKFCFPIFFLNHKGIQMQSHLVK